MKRIFSFKLVVSSKQGDDEKNPILKSICRSSTNRHTTDKHFEKYSLNIFYKRKPSSKLPLRAIIEENK